LSRATSRALDPQQVVEQPGDLVEHNADVLRTRRHLDAEQLLDGHHVAMLVAHHRHVVEPIHVGHGLDERARLRQLLGGPVQQADMRVGALDHFAVELQHEPQHAMGSRVLRAEVQRVVLDLGHQRPRP